MMTDWATRFSPAWPMAATWQLPPMASTISAVAR